MTDFLLWLHRFRTWVFNILAALIVVLPDLLNALAGHDLSAVIPVKYMPYVTMLIVVVNVLLRPRPALTKEERQKAVSEPTASPVEV